MKPFPAFPEGYGKRIVLLTDGIPTLPVDKGSVSDPGDVSDERRMQRIVLHGYTASPARVIQLAQSRYSMKRIPRVGSNVYVAMIEDESIGALLVRHPLVIRDETRRVEILLELNRVETIYGMSAEFTKILEVAQQPDPAMLRERSSS